MSNSFDAAVRVTQQVISKINQSGQIIIAICRYLSNNPEKNLNADEFKLLSDNNIKVVLVWEARGDLYSNFTTDQGTQDATRALAQAKTLNVPDNAAIYFAVDLDANKAQVTLGIYAYFQAVKKVFDTAQSKYRIGVYGNGLVCQTLLDAGLVSLCWLWGVNSSYGTQDFLASNKWVIHQHAPTTAFGVSVDMDDVQGDYGGAILGQTVVHVPEPQPQPAVLQDNVKPIIESLQTELQKEGFYTGQVDGLWGPLSEAAMVKYNNT